MSNNIIPDSHLEINQGSPSAYRNGHVTAPDIARDILRRGWKPVVLRAREKVPIHKDWGAIARGMTPGTIDGVFEPENNVGVLVGPASNDLIDLDLDCSSAVALALVFLPETHAKFGRKSKRGSHWLYYADIEYKKFEFEQATILEIRGGPKDHNTMLPGSVHPIGELVEWEEDNDPTRVVGVDLLQRAGILAAASLIALHWPESRRHDTRLALAGGLLRAGWTPEDVERFIVAVNEYAGGDEKGDRFKVVPSTLTALHDGDQVTGWPTLGDILGEKLVRKVLKWLGLKRSDYQASDGQLPISRSRLFEYLRQDEAGDAALLTELFQGKLVYDHQKRTWYEFVDHHWSEALGPPRSKIFSTVASLYLRLASEIQAELRETKDVTKLGWIDSLTARARKLRSKSRADNILAICQEGLHLGITGDEWDKSPELLGVLNGTVEMRTGTLREGRPEDYIRQVTPVEWRGLDEPAPAWEAFLFGVMSKEQERIDCVQRVIGYAASGLHREDVLGICPGKGGRNGKRVFFDSLHAALGDYCVAATTDIVIGSEKYRTPGAPQPHLVSLRGKRIVYCSETERDQPLNEARVKLITGGDTIEARTLNEKLQRFSPTHTPFLMTNFPPEADGEDDAFWERIPVIEFKERYVDEPREGEHQQDKDLSRNLQKEASGILAWIVRGYIKYLAQGFNLPQSMKTAKNKYREGERLTGWLDEMCELSRDKMAFFSDLYISLNDWRREHGYEPWTQTKFGRELLKRDGIIRLDGQPRKYRGIALKDGPRVPTVTISSQRVQ